ncbi:MAG: YceI family protein [Bacteroidetes bacterium]|nr:YceI family protein [Bacteroidota bacterium]
MKIQILSIAVLTATLFASCGAENTEENAEEIPVTEVVATSQTYSVDAASSSVIWRGEVAGVYGHDGFVKIASGTITTDGGGISGGEITIDMTTIAATDTASFKGDKKITDLEGHLTTGSFFNTAEFTTASFKITSVNGNAIKGDLTIRGIINEETYNVTSVDETDGGLKVSGTLVFDRQKYDVAWNEMKDMVLSDDITLSIELVAGK